MLFHFLDIGLIISRRPNKTHVMNLLAHIANKWKEIGEALSVLYHVLEDLQRSNDPNIIKLSDVIEYWLNRSKNASWALLFEMLDEPFVDEHEVGDDIRQFLSDPIIHDIYYVS